MTQAEASLRPEPVLPVSALQHYSYCPRQAALIHIEQTWRENLQTTRGRHVHQNIDRPGSSRKGKLRIEKSLPIWSDRLGLIGIADLVEIPRQGPPLPVEYKHGKRRFLRHDAIQLCAQGLCLEEMFGCPVPVGALYYHTSRRRLEVELDASLRAETMNAIHAVREQFRGMEMPPPVTDGRCRRCSLRPVCLPEAITEKDRLRRLHKNLFTVEGAE